MKGQPKSFISSKKKILIKTVPLFFSTANNEKEESTINTGESVYTQISKELFLLQRNYSPKDVYDQFTNDAIYKKIAEKKSGRKQNPETTKRLYSPVNKEVATEEVNIKTIQRSLEKSEWFTTKNDKSKSNSQFSSEKKKDSRTENDKLLKRKLMIENIWNSAGLSNMNVSTNAKEKNESRAALSNGSSTNSKNLKSPSIFTENKITENNFSQKPGIVKERCRSNKNRFDQFYESQIKFRDTRQVNILKELDKQDKLADELRKRKNMITLLSSGSKKILNKSKYNLHSDKMKFNIDPSYETNIKGKLSLDINMTASVDNNSSLLSVHERLYNEKHIIDERKKQLQQKYIKIDKFPQHSKSKSKSNERYSKKSQILKLSRSANNLSECFKNLQQSSQGCNQDDTSSAHNKSYGNITVNKVTEKLYQDAKRRQESISRLSKGKPRSRSSSNHRNLKSTKYLKETFERNFEQAVNKIF